MYKKAEKPLNPLLKMAILAGVESAVRIHIRRGDDLNARDGGGMTPLMLAASKNKSAICELLISAGADVFLQDPAGRNALAIASASGATEAVSVITALVSESSETELASGNPMPYLIKDAPLAFADEAEYPFDLSGWEAEEDDPAPVGDESLAEAASVIHRTISKHKPVDAYEDWGDFDAFLPEHATPLSRVGDEEGRVGIRKLLLHSLREGSVPELELEAFCAHEDGSRNEEGETLLRLVLAELGAEADERIDVGYMGDGCEESDYENTVIRDALAFLDDLGSGRNEPLRLYVRDMRGRKLLTAEEEISLGRAIEEGLAAALDVLASWPEGVASVIGFADQVRSGDAEVEDYSDGESPDTPDAGGDAFEEEEGGGAGIVALSPGARKFLERIEEIRRLAHHAGQGGAGEMALREALAAANQSRRFLIDLVAPVANNRDGAAGAFYRAVQQHAQARDRLAVSNLRLVISVAKRYTDMGLPFDDLIQEGNLGLLKAVDRYDWRKGFRFSTYAMWWIRQQVTRAVADMGKMIRIPVHVHEKILMILRESDEMERSTGRRPTVGELAERLSIPPGKVAVLLTRMEEPIPIDESGPAGIPPAELVEDAASPDPFITTAHDSLRGTIARMLLELDERTAKVLSFRYGLDGNDPLTLEEIGKIVGVTRERIRQIEAKGLRKLSRPANTAILSTFLDEVRQRQEQRNGKSTKAAENRASDDATGPTDSSGPFVGKPGRSESCMDAPERRKESSPTTKAKAVIPSPIGEIVERLEPKDLVLVIATARELGIPVEDRRRSGGDLLIRLAKPIDGKSRRLARKLIWMGFKYWPGIGYCK